MVLLCGIDEAGRGCVIGPLVLCGILIDEKYEEKLKSIGAKDSKLLTPKTREFLFEQIKTMVKKYKIVIIPPKEVDDAVLSSSSNLNWLEAIKSAEIIDELKPDKVILDCPTPNPKSYVDYVRNHIANKKVKLIAEHKADVNYPSVSAASILAKVTRDREIEKLKKKYKVEFGSGYPSDELTAEFIKNNYDKFDFFRKSWSTYKNVKIAKSQKNLGDY